MSSKNEHGSTGWMRDRVSYGIGSDNIDWRRAPASGLRMFGTLSILVQPGRCGSQDSSVPTRTQRATSADHGENIATDSTTAHFRNFRCRVLGFRKMMLDLMGDRGVVFL
ncbi:hypothetical protein Zmor_013575 [Zophobas morio]|uniref:Uncharacterized protein n=1 Tax=Zophobas morio TaxID=2755281 RepID=A0AA38IEB0_9CUCU|nr:hypothetical protein Zmor_013575 [Zophobas morio]